MATAAHRGPSNATIVRIVIVAAATILLLYGVYIVKHILMLVLVAAFLAAGLDPAVRRLEKMGMRRSFAIATIFLGALGFIAAFIAAVIPPLVDQITAFAGNLPDYIRNLGQNNPRIKEWISSNNIADNLQSAVSDIPKNIGGSLGNVIGIAGSVLSALFNGLTVMILTIYFLSSLSHIREGSMKLVPRSKREKVSELLDPILEKIGGYIAGQISVALIAGVLAFLFLLIVGMPFPVALALWVAISALIPMVGATLGAIPAVIVAFFTSTGLGIGTLVYFIVYQQVENYVIAPRIMTRAVDISPAAVLLSALIGGSLLGFVGALMAIPTAASLKLIFQEVVLPRTEKA
ncbi:MAG: AI-2E family transporter [Actinobacteria bacterium]|nr:AI-2E family transporter [Actinomycetota bacterium]